MDAGVREDSGELGGGGLGGNVSGESGAGGSGAAGSAGPSTDVRSWTAGLAPCPGTEPLQAHEGSIAALAHSPDGTFVATMDEQLGNAELKVWSAALQPLWKTATSFGGGLPNPQSFAFSGGSTIAINRIEAVRDPEADAQTSPTFNQWVQLLAAADGAELLRFPGAGAVTLALSPDGTLLAGGCQCSGGLSGARLWRNDGTAEPRLGEKGDQAFAVAFSPDGTLLAARAAYPTDAGRPRTTVWRVADRSLLWGQDAVAEPNSRLAYVAFSPDGARLVSLSVTVPVVKVYRTSDGFLEAEIPAEQPLLASFAPGNPDVLAIAERRGPLTLRRLHSAEPIATVSGTFTALSFSPDNHALLAGDTAGVVHQFCAQQTAAH